jgi:hypothetical protein
MARNCIALQYESHFVNRGSLFRFLTDDHARLAELLKRASADPIKIDYESYARFRAGLLKHIAWEEKILLPAARRLRGGEPPPVAEKLRRDHGALAALLVPTPSRAILEKIREILEGHNLMEEGPGGLYETCERIAGNETNALLVEMRTFHEVKLAAHVDSPQALEAMRHALERAGYSWEEDHNSIG